MRVSVQKRALFDEVNSLCTNYESIHTQCDGSRLLGYFLCKYATDMVGVHGGLIFFSKYFQKMPTWGRIHGLSSNDAKLNTEYDLSHRVLRRMKMCSTITTSHHTFGFGIKQKVQKPGILINSCSAKPGYWNHVNYILAIILRCPSAKNHPMVDQRKSVTAVNFFPARPQSGQTAQTGAKYVPVVEIAWFLVYIMGVTR